MTEAPARNRRIASLHRERAPCARCGEVLETDVPACPHCGNQPTSLTKWGSIAAMLVGTMLAVPMGTPMAYRPGSLAGVVLFCFGVGLYWVVTDRYSPTKHDATGRLPRFDSKSIDIPILDSAWRE